MNNLLDVYLNYCLIPGNESELEEFVKALPCGANLHEHCGCHKNLRLEHAIKEKRFWDREKKIFVDAQTLTTVPALELEQQISSHRFDYEQSVTLSKKIDRAFRTHHFFASFLTTASAEVPLWKRLVEYYINAVEEKLSHLMLMIDVASLTMHMPPDWVLPENAEELTDEILEELYHKMESFAEQQADESIAYLTIEGEKATHALMSKMKTQPRLGVAGCIFGYENAVNISIQVEIGKTYSLNRQEKDKGELLVRIMCDVLKGIFMQKRSPFVLSMNFVGPEYLAIFHNAQMARVVAFLYEKTGRMAKISIHAGEVCNKLVAASQRLNIVEYALNFFHANRIGHGTCISADERKILKSKGVALEACLTACCYILGKTHPIVEYIREGVDVVLSTDNQFVFETCISDEFKNAIYLIHRFLPLNFCYEQIIHLARTSIECSDLPGLSILSRKERFFEVKQQFLPFIERKDVSSQLFQALSIKSQVQIKHEVALVDFKGWVTKRACSLKPRLKALSEEDSFMYASNDSCNAIE